MLIDSFVIGNLHSEITEGYESCKNLRQNAETYAALLEKLLVRAIVGLDSAADALRVIELDLCDEPGEIKTIENWQRYATQPLDAGDVIRSFMKKMPFSEAWPPR